MKIAIISAMEKERALIAPMLDDHKVKEIDGLTATTGKIGKHEVILAKCGIGKVNAALNTYKIIKNFQPDLLINTGVAGGASLTTRIGDLLVADYVAYHDVWCGPGTQPGVADGVDVFMPCDNVIIDIAYDIFNRPEWKDNVHGRLMVGLICSGDRFISEAEEVKEIQQLFPQVLAVDMESAAIAHVCTLENIKFNIIRVISDTPGSGQNIEQYSNFWKEAPEKTFALVETILKEI